MSISEWVTGDMLGLPIPAHSEALIEAGAPFLTTSAFHATGALPVENQVTQITRYSECPRGSTGRKLLFSVAYERPAPHLHTDLFRKVLTRLRRCYSRSVEESAGSGSETRAAVTDARISDCSARMLFC